MNDVESAGEVWLSVCSRHQSQVEGCGACASGFRVSPEELKRNQELFLRNYPGWYALHNPGEVPGNEAWGIWEQLSGQSRPAGTGTGS